MEKSQWSIAEARLHLSEVIKRARKSPQFLKNRGHPVVAVIDASLLETIAGHIKKTPVALLMERLSCIIHEEGKTTDLPPPIKSKPRDPFSKNKGLD